MTPSDRWWWMDGGHQAGCVQLLRFSQPPVRAVTAHLGKLQGLAKRGGMVHSSNKAACQCLAPRLGEVERPGGRASWERGGPLQGPPHKRAD